jgi:hypothetical protein
MNEMHSKFLRRELFPRAGVVLYLVFLAAYSSASPKNKEPKSYPEQGKVLAIRVAEQAHGIPVYTDPSGKTRGGGSTIRRLQVYRIETETKFYV